LFLAYSFFVKLFEGKNLIGVHATAPNKYVTALMRIIFKKSELANGYVIEGPSVSKHIPLDIDRIKLLKTALFLKWKIKAEDQEEMWKKMKAVANRCCIDVRKRVTSINTSI
jgi:hypothetical protein